MGFLNPGYDDDYRIQSMPGTTDVPAAGALEGSLSAIPKGIASGFAKMYGLESDLADSPAGKYLGVLPAFAQFRNMSPEDRQRADAQAKVVGEWGATGQDPRITGTVGRIVSGTAEGLTIGGTGSLVGPWGAATLLGATEGHASYKEGVTQGLNPGAALDQATLTGLFSAAGALVPMKFGSTALTSILGGGAANVGLGAAQRGLTSAALEADGYPEQAKQYRIFDGEAAAADAILGSAFGYMGHFTHPDSSARTSPADVDAALAVSAEDHFNRSGPGVPVDPVTATLHADTMAAAMRSLADGDLPDVPPERAQQLVDNVIPDPMHDTAQPLHEAALEDLPGYADAIHEVPRMELPPETVPPLSEKDAQALGLQTMGGLGKGIGQSFVDGWYDTLTGGPKRSSAFKNERLWKDAKQAFESGEIKNPADLRAFIERDGATASQSKPAAAAGEAKPQPDVPLDPYHADALDHLVHNYPDETYLTDDGREVSYRQMAEEMQKQRNEADTFAKLHDVAAACAARNGV
jgi:hypothetical protein